MLKNNIVGLFLTVISGVGSFAQQLPWSVNMSKTAMSLWPKGNPAVWNYEQGLVMWSIKTVWDKTNDSLYYRYVQNKVDFFVSANGTISTYNSQDYTLDNVASARALLFLYTQTSMAKYKLAADKVRSQLATHPRNKAGGFWHKNSYPNQMWLDGLYMAAPFYAQYNQLFNQPIYQDDVTLQLLLMQKRSKDNATGMLYHGWDESLVQQWANPVTGCSPSFWGRGLGWYAMGLVDVLDYLPKDHPKRDSILLVVSQLAQAIVVFQEKNSGLWYQVLDKGGLAGNYLEASASCMFVYSLAKAVRKGYLDPSYWPSAKAGFAGIVSSFIQTDVKGAIHLAGNCPSAGLGGNPYRNGTYDYYVNIPTVTDDPKGIGAFILASVEMELGQSLLGVDQRTSDGQTIPSVSPNPVSEDLFVGNDGDSYLLKLYTSQGTCLSSLNGNRVSMHSLPSGVYYLEIWLGNISTRRKIIKW